jgi:hypothetical protein
MILSILTLISALSISATAAYFSIVGLATMFPGAQGSIIIMGTVLEVGKIIAAIWLHSNWNKASRLVKYYLSFAVGVLMLITSMGIFGFLSKSYIVHEAASEKELAQIQQVDNQIDREKDLINRYERSIESTKKSKSSDDNRTVGFIRLEEDRILKLNGIALQAIGLEQESVDKWLIRIKEFNEIINTINSKGGIFSNKKKKLAEEQERQAPEREKLNSNIAKAEERIQIIKDDNTVTINEIKENIKRFQSTVTTKEDESAKVIELVALINKSLSKVEDLEGRKFEITKKVSELNVEVGPIRYIVELFNDLGKEDLGLGTAVRIVILALIFVFDPLAVLLVVVSIASFQKNPNTIIKKEEKHLKKLEEESARKLSEIKDGIKEESNKLKIELENEKVKQEQELSKIKDAIEKKNEATRQFTFGENRQPNNESETNWNKEES